jgi:hypothetical protein
MIALLPNKKHLGYTALYALLLITTLDKAFADFTDNSYLEYFRACALTSFM